MDNHGSSTLGSRPDLPPAPPGTDPNASGPAPGPRARTPLNLMSPFRIGFLATIGALLAYGLARAVIQAQSILILVVVALFIALGLNPLVRGLTRRGVKRGLAVLLVLVGVLLVFVLAGFAVVPVFVEQIGNLVRSGPD